MAFATLSRRSFIASTTVVAAVPIIAEAADNGPIVQLYREFRRREAIIETLPRDTTVEEVDWMRAPLDEAMQIAPDGNAEWAALVTMAMWVTGADVDATWENVVAHCRSAIS